MRLPNKASARAKKQASTPDGMTARDLPDRIGSIGLPGENPYDEAVAAGEIDYAEAKIREEVMRVREVTERERITNETARIALEKERLALEQARGSLITRDESAQRLSIAGAAFQDLVRMLITRASVSFPASQREKLREELMDKANDALTTLAECIKKKQTKEVTERMLGALFQEGPAE